MSLGREASFHDLSNKNSNAMGIESSMAFLFIVKRAFLKFLNLSELAGFVKSFIFVATLY